MYNHDNRLIKITTVLGENTLLATQFSGSDSFFNSFNFSVEMISTEKNIPLKKLLFTTISISIQVTPTQVRYFHGVIIDAERGMRDGHFYHYRIQVRPRFWLLNLTRQYRFFQYKTVPDIIKTLMYDAKIIDIEFRLKESYQEREYCCQYGESTYDFLHRLMEEEGIFYFYEHSQNTHKLVFTDDVQGLQAVNSNNHDIASWYYREKCQPGKILLSDFYHETPQAQLHVAQNNPANAFEVHHHPADFTAVEEGQRKVKLHKLAHEAQAMILGGESNDIAFAPGKNFSYEGNTFYLLSVEYHVTDNTYFSHGSQNLYTLFTCLPINVPYKPLKLLSKPKVMGVETAFVVGKEGSEIDVDEQGRVRVRFHWEQQNATEDSGSCWLRVAQLWTGNNYGMQFLPRVGQEVIVQFVHGDPDRPLIMGSLFNAEHQPLYKLPHNKTRSGIKTRSTPNGSNQEGNELSFEDAKDKEEIFLHAQKDFKRIIQNSEQCLIKKGNFHITVSQGEILLSAKKKLVLQAGDSKIEMNDGDISIFAKKIIVKK